MNALGQALLDTHALLWFLFDDARLSERACEVIEDPKTEKLLSVASLWEIVIKMQLDKLHLGMSPETFFADFIRGRLLALIPIELPHLLAYHALPLVHRDPFDRLLIAQAQVLGVPIVTADGAFSGYDVETIWEGSEPLGSA